MNPIRSLARTILMLGIAWLSSCSNAAAAPPEIRVTPIPAEYRKIGKFRDYIYLESTEFYVLNSGRCAVVTLRHTILKGKFGFPEVRTIGVVAIDLRSGAAKLLQLDSKSKPAVPKEIRFILPLGKNSIAVAVRIGKSSSDSRRDDIWRWTPGTDRVERLRQHPLLVELMDVLDGTSYRIAKPADRRSKWNGQVTLISGGHRDVQLHLSGKPTEYWSYEQRFLRGTKRDDLVVCTMGEKPEKIWLKRIRLGKTPAIPWSITKAAFEKSVGMEVSSLTFPKGIERGYRLLPFAADGYAENSQWLCSIDPESGRIRKVHNFKGTATPFPASSADGGLVAYSVGGLPEFGIAVVDVLSGKVIVNRMLKLDELGFTKNRIDDDGFSTPFATPVGFLPDKTVMIMDSYNLWTLAHPYTGPPKLLFSLTTEKPGYCCSR